MDPISTLAAWFQPWALWLYKGGQALGLRPRITSTYRSYATQAHLRDAYLAGRSTYPAAAPGCSWHEYGLAFDMASDNPALLGQYWKAAGGGWFANDPIHYQWAPQPACGTRGT